MKNLINHIISLVIGEIRDEVPYERVEFKQPTIEYYHWHYNLKINQL